MTQTVPIIWHDLIADPNDLPEADGYYWCIEKNRYTDEICFFSYASDDSVLGYVKRGRVWTFEWDDGYGVYGGLGCRESYGTKRNLDITEEEDPRLHSIITEAYFDEFIVIAWAKIPEEWPGRKEYEK